MDDSEGGDGRADAAHDRGRGGRVTDDPATATEFRDRVTDAVALVSDETRAGILVALATSHREAPRSPTLRFSDLRRRVGHDDPGNFNYHLKRLTGGLVRKTDDGYRLSDVGQRFVGTLLSGRFDPAADVAVSDVELPCLVCGGPVVASYERGLLRVACEADHEFRANVGPSMLADRSVEEAVRVALQRSLFEWRSAAEGVCPLCDGPTSVEVESRDPSEPPVVYRAICRRCGLLLHNTADGCVLDHPAVVSLCYEHGIDVRTDTWTALADHVGPSELVSDDPLRVDVEVAVDGESLVGSLDASATVAEVVASGSPGSNR